MSKTNNIIDGVSEAIRFVQENWVDERSPVWEGDVHEFMANVVHEDVTIFDVVHVLASISKGDHIQELDGVVVKGFGERSKKSRFGNVGTIHKDCYLQEVCQTFLP